MRKKQFSGKQHGTAGAGGLRCSAGSCTRRGRRRTRPPRGRQQSRGSWEEFLYLHLEKVPRSSCLFQWNEPGGVGGTNTGPAVLHRLVGDGELPQVVTDHLGLQEKQRRALEARTWAGRTAPPPPPPASPQARSEPHLPPVTPRSGQGTAATLLSLRWRTPRTQPALLAPAWRRALETPRGERALPEALLGAGSELSEARSSLCPSARAVGSFMCF